MVKKIKILGAALGIVIAQLLIAFPVNAAVDTCTWTGAVNSNWSNGGNWSGCDTGGVPEFGDSLIFPESASNKNTNNDFFGAIFDTVQILGSGYTLSGGSITITGTTPLVVNQSATINLDITYQPSMNAFLRVAATQTLTVNGVTNFSGIGGEVNVGGGGFSGTIDFVGNITGDAGSQFIAVNDATAIVRGAANTYTAATVGSESNGRFECRSLTCFGNNANDIYTGGGEVALYQTGTYSNDWQTSAPTADTSWLLAYENISITGSGTVNDPIGISQDVAGKALQFTGAVTLNGAASLFAVDNTAYVRVDGTVGGAEAFSIGSGSFRLSGSNNYAGTNTINSGAIVEVTNANALGNTTGITNILSGGVVRFNFGASTSVPENFQVVGSGSGALGALVQAGESTTLSGSIVLAGNTTFGVDTTSPFSAFNLSGVISGTGDITLKTSPSTVVADTSIQFTGSAANTYTGKVTVSGVRFYPAKSASTAAVTGDLEITATASKLSHVETSSNEVIADASHVTLTDNGAYKADLSIGTSATETIGYITGDGEVSLGAQSNLIFTYAGDYTFSGEFSKFANFPAGVSKFTKQGAGTATFTGGINSTYGSFYPTFNVAAGTIKANSSGFSDVNTNVGSGSVLKGSGTLGYVSIQAGGAINVGTSPGCMTLGTLDLTAGSTYIEEIAGTTACTSYDRATVSGTAALNDATLTIDLSTTPPDGTVFTIISAASVTGTFAGLANGATVTANGVTFRINYTANTVTLTKLTGTATVTPNTGLQKQNTIAIVASLFGAIGLLLAVKRYGKKTAF